MQYALHMINLKQYGLHVFHHNNESFEHIQWSDELIILNTWKYKPSFKEVFESYRKRIKETYLIIYEE